MNSSKEHPFPDQSSHTNAQQGSATTQKNTNIEHCDLLNLLHAYVGLNMKTNSISFLVCPLYNTI